MLWTRPLTLRLQNFGQLAGFFFIFANSPSLSAAETNDPDRAASELLPATVVALAEIANLADVVETVFNHPLRQRLLELPAYQAVLNSEPFQKFRQGVNAFETSMGQPWQPALRSLTDGGVTVALDASHSGGVALLVKSSDPAALQSFREFVMAVRLLVGGGKLAQQGEYRGFTAVALNANLKMAQLGNWLLVTNHSELGKSIIDQYIDRGPSCLHSHPRFQTSRNDAQATTDPAPAVRGYLDIEALRNAGVAKDLFNAKVDNFFGELVLGGMLANIRKAPYATLELEVAQTGIQVELSTPHNRGWEAPREYYFGSPALASAPPLLPVANRLFAISSHRDLSQMWLRSGDLLSDRAVDQLAQADTQLTTFFSGRDFGEDILGSFASDICLVGKAQSFEDQLPRPAIKLPAFAIQFRMLDPQSTQPELRRIFQSFIGFLNITGAMNGQPQFDLGMEQASAWPLYTATYVPNREQSKSLSAPINFNFSPTIAFADDRFILSSSTSLARDLVALEEVASDKPHDSESNAIRSLNTTALVDATVLKEVLKANQTQLVANSMLEKGQSQEAAEAEIELLLELLGYLHHAQLGLEIDETQMLLKLGVTVTR